MINEYFWVDRYEICGGVDLRGGGCGGGGGGGQ